ncbi:MAG TPA: hypothetical protein VFR69_13535, partial [Rubrobacteraceae bacterium]|nr:hypothetical protein [Rubrobacteraceae bacterium]
RWMLLDGPLPDTILRRRGSRAIEPIKLHAHVPRAVCANAASIRYRRLTDTTPVLKPSLDRA